MTAGSTNTRIQGGLENSVKSFELGSQARLCTARLCIEWAPGLCFLGWGGEEDGRVGGAVSFVSVIVGGLS